MLYAELGIVLCCGRTTVAVHEKVTEWIQSTYLDVYESSDVIPASVQRNAGMLRDHNIV